MSHRPATVSRRRSYGFSLIEVLVALIVLSVGLLGIAKMEALALASNGVAGRRALAAIEAASLADSMHVNRTYWGSTASGANITVSGNQVATGLPVSPAPDCTKATGAACDAPSLASYDLNQWAIALHSLLPADTATVACNTSTPVECLITISWNEQAVAMNSAQAGT
ncbi:MAG TPA: type IV pilus modification protein PilV, partial [Steroidobacteraceae bacterium]